MKAPGRWRRRGVRSAATALVLTLAWVLAPVPAQVAGAQTSPGPNPEVTLTAVPRWGPNTPGSWTTYLVTVRNDGLSAVEGTVVLVPQPGPPPTGYPLQVEGDAQSTLADLPRPASRVVTLGDTEYTVAGPFGPRPLPADFPTYRAEVSLPAGGGERTLSILTVEAPNGYRAELQDRAGRSLAIAPAAAAPKVSERHRNIALLSPTADAKVTASLSNFLRPVLGTVQSSTVTTVPSVREVPDSALLFSGVDVVIVAGLDTAGLTPGQLRSLQDYVALGGSLVLTGGADGARGLQPLPDALVPLRPTGTADASLAALADLRGQATTAIATVVTGEVQSGRSVLQTESGQPLVVQGDYGAGRVIQLTYDPLADPVAADPFLRDLAWHQGLSRGLVRFGHQAVKTPPGIGPPDQLWAPALGRQPWPTPPAAQLWILAAYAALVIPLGWGAVVRRRPRLVWALLPLTAVAVGAAVGVTGAGAGGAPEQVVQVRTTGPGDVLLTTTYRGVPAGPQNGDTLEIGVGDAASTVLTRLGPLGVSAYPDVATVGGGGTVSYGGAGGSGEVALPPRRTGMGTVQRLSLEQLPGLESRLRLEGTDPSETSGPRLAGSVTNRSSGTLRKLRAQLPDGSIARLADVLQPGQTLEVTAPLVLASADTEAAPGRQAEPDELAMFAAASAAFTRAGQAVVVGLDQDHGGSTTSVVVEVVPLEAGFRPIAYLDGATQVLSTVTGPDDFLTTVYDLGGLPGVGPLELIYTSYAPPPEVYDWTSRTWRRVPAAQDGPTSRTPLTESEVDGGGLVRLRVGGQGGAGSHYQITAGSRATEPTS